MFSIKKATLFGITALTSIAMSGTFSTNSAQAAVSNRSESILNTNSFNTEVEIGNSSVNQSEIETTEFAAFIRRGKIRQKPTAGYKVTAFTRRIKIRQKPTAGFRTINETNNNKPASVTNPVRERSNNSQSVTNNSNNQQSEALIRRGKLRQKPTAGYRTNF